MRVPNPLEFLQEDNGRFSSSRLFAFAVVLGCMVDWMHWTFTQTSPWAPTPQTVGIIIGTVGAKVVQKFGETRTDGQP